MKFSQEVIPVPASNNLVFPEEKPLVNLPIDCQAMREDNEKVVEVVPGISLSVRTNRSRSTGKLQPSRLPSPSPKS